MVEKSDPTAGNASNLAGHVAKWIGVVIALALVLGLLVQALWNWLMPEIFDLRKITLLQGIGLILLARVLFGRMGQRRDHAGYLTGKYGFRGLAWFGGSSKERPGDSDVAS